jgi:hypothetical protein
MSKTFASVPVFRHNATEEEPCYFWPKDDPTQEKPDDLVFLRYRAQEVKDAYHLWGEYDENGHWVRNDDPPERVVCNGGHGVDEPFHEPVPMKTIFEVEEYENNELERVDMYHWCPVCREWFAR